MRLCFYGVCFRNFFFGALAAVFALLVSVAPAARAQNIITGTAGFETGLQKLGHPTDFISSRGSGTVDWGDDKSNATSPGLVANCVLLNGCDVLGTHAYVTAGQHTITVTYNCTTTVTGSTQCETFKAYADIGPPGNFVIVTMGDSVASGEGVPRVDYSLLNNPAQAYWDDPTSDYGGEHCHRSLNAGFVMAQNEIQNNNPAITTINYACSGHNVGQTIQDIRNLRLILPRIDVLVMSSGADNVDGGFGNLITTCLNDFSTPCSQDPNFTENTQSSIDNLGSCKLYSGPSSPNVDYCYPQLAEEINCINPKTGMQEPSCSNPSLQIPKLVLITEYFDPTHDQNGEFPTKTNDPNCKDGDALQADWPYLYNTVVLGLNNQVNSFPSLAYGAGLDAPTYAVDGMQKDFFYHGYCAGNLASNGNVGQRWVNNAADSLSIQGDANGTSHPNPSGQADYQQRIYNAIVAYNPPVTTAIATTADGASYTFGTWTNQDVDVNFSSTNAIKESGVGPQYYAVDNPNCFAPGGTGAGNCTEYTGPVTISSTGAHTLTFFGTNASGNPEESHDDQVLIDKNPPLSMGPGEVVIRPDQTATFNVTLGHLGWGGETVNLTCSSNEPHATCAVNPSSVALGGTGNLTSTAVVSTAPGAALAVPGDPSAPVGLRAPIDALSVLRALLALATGLFLAAAGWAVRRRRWARVSELAALAVLFGALCAGCSKPTGTAYAVTVTGTSTGTVHIAGSTLVVQ